MKFFWLLSFYFAFSAEVRVKASVAHQTNIQSSKVFSCQDSWIEKDTLIAGCHWITGPELSKIQTEFGEIHARNSDYTVRKADRRIYVVNHLSDLRVILKDGRIVQVPHGFEFWFSELDANKKNTTGLLRPVDMTEHIKLLNSVWVGDSKELREKIVHFKSRWGNRTEMAARFYQGLALRKIASAKMEEDNLRKASEAEKRRREANRKVLFERVFGR